MWWRPRRREWWMAVLFVIGSFCFLVGGVAAQWARTSRPAIGVVFFVGSIFFTSAAYLQYAEAVNVERTVGQPPGARRGPLAAGVVGTAPDRLAGRAGAVRGHPVLQRDHLHRHETRLLGPSDEREGVGTRRVRLGRLPDLQRARLRRGLPSLAGLEMELAVLADRGAQHARVDRLRGVCRGVLHRARRRRAGERPPGQRGNLAGRIVLPGGGTAADARGGRRGARRPMRRPPRPQAPRKTHPERVTPAPRGRVCENARACVAGWHGTGSRS